MRTHASTHGRRMGGTFRLVAPSIDVQGAITAKGGSGGRAGGSGGRAGGSGVGEGQ